MRAVRLQEPKTEPILADVPIPTPGPGEVLLRVDAAGLCHSDLHLMEWPASMLPFALPFTLGHETAGTVAALGLGANGVSEGERVVVYGRWGCGSCTQCLQGRDNRCQTPAADLGAFGSGAGRDGGLADYMLVPSARYLVGIGDLDAASAAPLTDAALTPYHAIRRCAQHLLPGVSVLVIGVGGIGHMAVQLFRALSSVRVVAVDLREDALELARDAGAELAISASGLKAPELRAELGPPGAAVVLDCVASDATLELASEAVSVGGEIVYLGRGGGSLPVSPGRLPFESSVSLPSWGSLPELAEVVALARSGAISVEVERLALEQAVEGYRRLRRGEITGRAVAIPDHGHRPG